MRTAGYLGFCIVFRLGLAAAQPELAARQPSAPPDTDETLQRELFDVAAAKLPVQAALVMLDLGDGRRTVMNPTLAKRRLTPASTFKIPNALISLEAGVVPKGPMKWDGVVRSRAPWNHDHDLASAMRDSVVWYFQALARSVGAPRMKAALERFDYGNRDISAGIDQFWLEKTLLISADEEVDFLRKLVLASDGKPGGLPVTQAHAQEVLRIIERDRRDGAVFRGKTGTAGGGVAWLVGETEWNGRRTVYAAVVTCPPSELDTIIAGRDAWVRRMLVRLGALPPSMRTAPEPR